MATAASHVGIDEATLKRDRRGAEEPMGVWPIAENLWKVGTGSGAEYSEYIVDLAAPACTCDDWHYRGGAAIARCKHASRVLQVLDRIEPPVDADVDGAFEAQRDRWSA